MHRENSKTDWSYLLKGPIIRWQPNLLLVNDPSYLPLIYNHKADKTPHYNMSTSGVEGLVEAQNWEDHRNRRKRIFWPVGCTPIEIG